MTHQPARAAEPRHSCGGAGGAARGQWVRYPLRIVLDCEAYADADTKVYGKVKALSRGRRCEAAVEKIAAFVGLALSTVEKALSRLSRPAPSDGVIELYRRQRSHAVTGNGRTNERWCRDLEAGERYVSAPVLAADTLRGTTHRLYLLLRYAEVVEKRQLTLAEMGQALRHRSGGRKGQALAEAVVSRLLDELAGLGWIALDRRAGYRGRHLVTVHDHPVRPVDEEAVTPDAEGGAAPDLEGGALAYKEDHESLNDLEKSATAGGAFRRRRDDRKWVAAPVDTAGNGSPVASVAPATFRPRAERPAYGGPPLGISVRVWAVLEPVRDLLPAAGDYAVRRAAREIGAQLDSGVLAEDIRDQVQRLRTWTPSRDIRDPGRWLIGAVLPVRPGRCGTADCVHGIQRWTGLPCKACEETPTRRRGGRGRPPAPPPAPLQTCPGCDAPYRPPLRHPTCRLCRTPLTA